MWAWLVFFLLVTLGAWFMTRMPGRSYAGVLPPLTAAEEALCGRLKSHVGMLAGTIGERNLWRAEALQAAAGYIEQAVLHLMGVKGVTNAITVTPHVPSPELTAKIEEALQRNANLAARRIQVEVQGSKVLLRGSVSSLFERDEAEQVAWSAPGVSHVENHLIVTP